MQVCNADDLGISQPSFIRFPLDNQQLHMIKANFMAAGMAGVVGAVDGTHIQISAPSKDEDVFVNRKKVHSINTQIAFDATFNILDVAKWPAGSTHDPRILMGSGLRREWLSLQDVLTPYLNPQPGAQLKYNMQVITQITISPMRHTKIHEILWREDVITVITVCAILHNRDPEKLSAGSLLTTSLEPAAPNHINPPGFSLQTTT
ncbi:putative nuclease HARBI1 [Merluccius polli]|uniref:Nuclease HARBI1 n=1 Tax=Merluccius polli TaxID=89951 RepID=A0AA47MF57_MERPO|nr:putative nuclease HARBI1 [Merluccius polli]